MNKLNHTLLAFSLFLCCPVFLIAQNYSHQNQVLSSGGGPISASIYENFSIIGEPCLSSELSGGIYSATIGFFPEPAGFVGIEDAEIPLIKTYMSQNYPNPFNPITTIDFSLKDDSQVIIIIYNIKGQKIKTLVNDFKESGNHSVTWNGKDHDNKHVASGIYFYHMKTSNYDKIRKMIMLK